MSSVQVGFTGTSNGMTPGQKIAFLELLNDLSSEASSPPMFHHGCAVGADLDAATLAKDVGWWVIGHPCRCPQTRIVRSNWTIMDDETRSPHPFLARNRHIVSNTDLLIACPSTKAEVKRSGTWSTIRYARSESKDLYIIWPDGTVRKEEGSA